MRKYKISHIGMRTIKTSLAIMICLALGLMFGYPAPIYACIAVVMTIRETVDESIKYSISRILATIFGGAAGLIVLGFHAADLNPWLEIPVIGAAVILTIHVTILVKCPDITALTVVILLIIVLNHTQDEYAYAVMRMIETVIGIVVAVVINLLLSHD